MMSRKALYEDIYKDQSIYRCLYRFHLPFFADFSVDGCTVCGVFVVFLPASQTVF